MKCAPIVLVVLGLFGNSLPVRVSLQLSLNGTENSHASSMEVDVHAKFKSGQHSAVVALSVSPQKGPKKGEQVPVATRMPAQSVQHNMSDEFEEFDADTVVNPPGIPVVWNEFPTHDPRIFFMPKYIANKNVLVQIDPLLTPEQVLVQILLLTTLRAFKLGEVSEYYFKDGMGGFPQKDFMQNGDFIMIKPSNIGFHSESDITEQLEQLLNVRGEDEVFYRDFQDALKDLSGGTVKEQYAQRDGLIAEWSKASLEGIFLTGPKFKFYRITTDSKSYANLLFDLQNLWSDKSVTHMVVDAPWFRFCQMERMPRYYVGGGGSPISKFTKNPMDDLQMSIKDIAASDDYYLEMASSDVYLRHLWFAATRDGERSAEITMVDAHETFPLSLTTIQLMREFHQPLLLVLYSALKSLLIHTFADLMGKFTKCRQPGLFSNLLKMDPATQLLIVAPDAGQRHRLNDYFQELTGEAGGDLSDLKKRWGEDNSAERFLAAAHMGKFRMDWGVELRCCSDMDHDISKTAEKDRVAEEWAKTYFKYLEAKGMKRVIAVVVDDLTNSGGTLFTAANLLKTSLRSDPKSAEATEIKYYAFVTHLVAGYDQQKLAAMYNALKTKRFKGAESALEALITTDTLPDIIKQLPTVISQVEQVPLNAVTGPQRIEVLNWRTSVPTGIKEIYEKSKKRSCSTVGKEMVCPENVSPRYINPTALSPGSNLPWE